MELWSWIVIVLVALFFVWVWFDDRRQKERQAKRFAEMEERRTSEEYVIQRQMKFEEQLRKGAEIGLPDAILWRKAHIYRYLMSRWFDKLVAQSRYDEPKLKKLRKDWTIYMDGLERAELSSFMSAESDNDKKRESYGNAAREGATQVEAIEDAFAEAVGPEAVEKLREVRAKGLDNFSRAGEMAADGYEYPAFPKRGEVERPVPRKANS